MDLSQYLHPDMIAKLQTGGYIIMLILMIVEWPVVTFIAGFLASLWVFDIWVVLTLWWIGDILGDMIFFMIGWFWSSLFAKKTSVKTVEQSGLIEKLDHLIRYKLFLSILVIKFTPYAPPIGLTYIGKLHTNVKQYFLYSTILSIPIPFVTGGVGFHLGYINTILAKYSGWELLRILSFSIFSIVALIAITFYMKSQSKKILEKTPEL